jgi:hypothetical protein
MDSQLRQEYSQLIAWKRYENPKRLNQYGYSLYSQTDEDGIINEIFRRIGTTNKVFIEFGASDGLETNCHALLLQGWKGLWIDGNNELISKLQSTFGDLIDQNLLKVENEIITPTNANKIIEKYYSDEIDILSIDIDGNDFYVLDSLTCVNPRLIIVEYNARKGPSIDWVMEYNPNHSWDGSTDYFGASLKAFENLLNKRKYSLVGCSTSGINAFFVRTDLIENNAFLTPFTSEEHYEPQRKHIGIGMHTAHHRNYGKWKTSGEILKKNI